MARVYVRKFDYDEARRRYAAGESGVKLAHEYGVSATALYRVVNPEFGARLDARSAEWQRSGRCPDCGTQTTRRAHGYVARCVQCAATAQATSARDGELQCQTCREWMPDDTFPHDKRRIGRRGRHKQCRVCLTEQKRAWRAKNPTYERDYARQRRAA